MASPNVTYISDAEFQTKVLESEKPVLLDFTAVWCGPCKAIAPHLDSLADANLEKIRIFKIDIDANQNTPLMFGVQSIPTLILFKAGKMADRKVGSLSKAALEAWVTPHL